jgi:hypothetical protein
VDADRLAETEQAVAAVDFEAGEHQRDDQRAWDQCQKRSKRLKT